jgi:hypothetical protein
VHEGDELADLQTFFLSLPRAAGETASFGDRFAVFNGELSRDFEESKLRRAGLIVSLGDILIDVLEVAGVFGEQDGLLEATVELVVCLLVGDNGFDTFGLLLALTKREPPSAAHLDTLSSMLTKGNLRSDPIKRATSRSF